MKRHRTSLPIVAALGALGATAVLVAAAGTGSAARQAAPGNTQPPTVTGTPSEGSTLTASNGQWTGSPTSFDYRWQRCDRDGGSCAAISGATQRTYVLKAVDAGNTLRVRVTARNADGENSVSSVPTALVKATPQPAATGCPAGTGAIQAEQLALPARLTIDQQQLSPGVVGGSSQSLSVRFRVSACGGRPVQGALVLVTAVPYNQFSVPSEQQTGADGWATLTMQRLQGFPAARRQQLLVMFARARKAGDDVLGGSSTRRLVSFPVRLSA
jgi:hypothetical protein